MPILLKDVSRDYYDYSNIGSLPIMSSTGDIVPLEQITDGLDLGWEERVITRYNRERFLAAQCDPILGIGNKEIEANLMPLIEAIPFFGIVLRFLSHPWTPGSGWYGD